MNCSPTATAGTAGFVYLCSVLMQRPGTWQDSRGKLLCLAWLGCPMLIGSAAALRPVHVPVALVLPVHSRDGLQASLEASVPFFRSLASSLSHIAGLSMQANLAGGHAEGSTDTNAAYKPSNATLRPTMAWSLPKPCQACRSHLSSGLQIRP